MKVVMIFMLIFWDEQGESVRGKGEKRVRDEERYEKNQQKRWRENERKKEKKRSMWEEERESEKEYKRREGGRERNFSII